MTFSLLFSKPRPYPGLGKAHFQGRPSRIVKGSVASALATALLLCTACLILTGCGQKGPLLLPESETSTPNSGDPAQQNTDDEEETSRNDSADGVIHGG